MAAVDTSGALARLMYQDGSVERTLLANGRIKTKRDMSGSDSGITGAMFDPVEVRVRDARELQPAAALDTQGFELRRAPTALVHEQFYNEGQLLGHYLDECTRLVQAATGAAVVKAFDYNVRSQTGSAAKVPLGGSMTVQPPALAVHNDYTVTSGPARLRQLADPPLVNDISRRIHGEAPLLSQAEFELAKDTRWALINVWRNIREQPVQVLPLALCDARSLAPEDLCVFELHYADRVGENYFAAHSPRHTWWYYPEMVRDEALLIKQWDSQGTLVANSGSTSTFSLHTAFYDPGTPDGAPDRESVEVRCLCIYGAGTHEADAPRPKL